MTKTEFLRELETALEVAPNTLTPATVLADTEAWDSMSALIFMSLADEELETALTGDQLANCRTVGDLLDLLADGLSE